MRQTHLSVDSPLPRARNAHVSHVGGHSVSGRARLPGIGCS
jgi:hypothetical protein